MGRVYLIASAVLFVLLLLVFVAPFAAAYAGFTHGLKGLEPGAWVVYVGQANFYASSVSFGRGPTVFVSLGYELRINVTRSGVTADLRIYNLTSSNASKPTSGRLVFAKSIKLRRSNPLLEFLFPNSTRVELSGYGYEVRICPHPSPYVLADRGIPSDLGVPRYYAGALIIKDGGITIGTGFPSTYPKCWKCMPRVEVGTFFNYVRISKGFMLVDYQACLGGFMCGVTNKAILGYFLKHGSPLLNMLVKDFNITCVRKLMHDVREIHAKYHKYPALARETITLDKTNVWPTDQQWLAGIEALYMMATPFSQAMTVAAVVLLALYFRRR